MCVTAATTSWWASATGGIALPLPGARWLVSWTGVTGCCRRPGTWSTTRSTTMSLARDPTPTFLSATPTMCGSRRAPRSVSCFEHLCHAYPLVSVPLVCSFRLSRLPVSNWSLNLSLAVALCNQVVKYMEMLALAVMWKWFYYAPNTLKEMYDRQIALAAKKGDTSIVQPFDMPTVRKMWGVPTDRIASIRRQCYPGRKVPKGQEGCFSSRAMSVREKGRTRFRGKHNSTRELPHTNITPTREPGARGLR